jgi:DMSO/TMAO reductase YedYZ molybdopterin-dependent catalytic subunit
MKMRIIVGIAALALVVIVLINGPMSRGGDPIELDGVEVREYQGQNLSSVQDFRENSIKGPQFIDVDTYRLKISGLVESPGSYTYSEIVDSNTHYSKVVTLYCVEGWEVTILWEGLLFRDMVAAAGPLPEATVVILYAEDGYSTSFPIEYFMENDIIAAYKMNDVTLPPERGFPFQLVAESKWGYKWIKWITEIEFSDDTDYEGYWESRGYSNDGDLDDSFYNYPRLVQAHW